MKKYHVKYTIFFMLILASLLPLQNARSEPLSTSITISGKVIPRTCAFEDDIQHITLPEVLSKDFNDKNSTGHTEFTVNISSCAPAIEKLNLRFSGETTTGQPAGYFLNKGSAVGFSLVIYTHESEERVSPDKKIEIPVQGGNGSIRLIASYMRHSEHPVAGSFSSTANIHLEYL